MQVGRYRFVDRLAVGGMAEVFVAIAQGAEGFEKPVVIKRMLPQLAQNPRFRQMFLDEAQIMLNLQHGNIVQILDMGKMDTLPFLALEYVDGRDLRTVLNRSQELDAPIPHGLIAYVASEVCRALDYAHRKQDDAGEPLNIVHRDVNPANIFLSHEGEVKVGDFGLAKARDNLNKSDAGIIKGKYSYLSPEQARGHPVDHRSDIYSLGTTLYELTCGRRPFVAASDVDVVMLIREARVVPPSKLVEGFNPDLEAIVLRSMQEDPGARYPTAAAMRDDLNRYLQSLPTTPGDRELTDCLDELFAAERRSNSFLIKLCPEGVLPPPMAAVSHAGGISKFSHHAVEPLPGGGATGQQPPPPARREATAHPAQSAQFQPLPLPMSGASAPRRRSRGGAAIAIAAVLLAVAAMTGALVYKAATPETASLSVTSTPSGAEVLIDGKPTGHRTPALISGLTLDLDHVVALRHPETAGAHRSFNFREGGRRSFEFRLVYTKQALRVESTPTAGDVLLAGELRGQTPLTLRLERGAKHVIRLRKTGYLDKEILHLADRPSAALRLQLEPAVPLAARVRPRRKARRKIPRSGRPAAPKPGAPAAKEAPAGVLEVVTKERANVYIDKRFVGRTPGFRMLLPAGTYQVTVSPLGTNIHHRASITIRPRRTHRFKVGQ